MKTLINMEPAHIDALETMVSGANRVLEWGAGYSTRHFCSRFPGVEWHAIEHSAKWCGEALAWSPGNGPIVHVCNLQSEWYVNFPLSLGRFDVAVVDGRRRVECVAVARRIASIVLLHDAQREKYAACLDGSETMICAGDDRMAIIKGDA